MPDTATTSTTSPTETTPQTETTPPTETAPATRSRRSAADFAALAVKPITKEYTRHDKLADLVDARKIVKDGINRADESLKAMKALLKNIDEGMDSCEAPKKD